MKLVTLPEIRLNVGSIEEAMAAVFHPRVLRLMHGPSLSADVPHLTQAAPKRRFGFKIDVSDVPAPIRRFFCGSQMRITTRQTLTAPTADLWKIDNNLKLHFVGAELFKLRPQFVLKRTEDGSVCLTGTVRHDAVLPPPLNGIAEDFMALNTRKELLHFASCLREEGVIL